MPNMIMRATDVLLGMIERMLKADIHVEGVEHITDHPTLFVVNHFTRMETFLVPYLLHKHTGMVTHSLAHSTLFQGLFGRYLEKVGAMPHSAPLRNREIIKGLLTGKTNWVIYPEGVMVKNKDVMEDGRFVIHAPDRHGPPHTGAAVLALRSELVRHDILKARDDGNESLIRHYLTRYGLKSVDQISSKSTHVVPSNLTYYPIRPGRNLLSDMAAALIKHLPERLEEELETEGAILFSDSDITLYFDQPMDMIEEVNPVLGIYNRHAGLLRSIPRDFVVMGLKRKKLTQDFMTRIYTHMGINLDNLYCMGLRKLRRGSVREEDFKRALFLSSVEAGKLEDRRIHDSLREDFLQIITDSSYEPYDDIRALAIKEGAVTIEDDKMRVAKTMVTRRDYDFHDIRLKHIVSVLANELAPVTRAVRIIESNVNQSSKALKARIVEVLSASDQERYEYDHDMYHDEELSKSVEVGRPYFLRARDRSVGIVLSHGFLAAPEEVRMLAEWLHSKGYSVYAPCLKGMGTAPHQMRDVSWGDWQQSYSRAYAILRNHCDRVVLGGFSAGGLLGLLRASRLGDSADGVITINAPTRLADSKTKLVPAAMVWNEVLEQFHIKKGHKDFVDHECENPEINYARVYFRGLNELSSLMKAARHAMPDVKCPTLIIQGDEDPAIAPESGDFIHENIGSERKNYVKLKRSRHGIIRGEGCEEVFDLISGFLSTL